MSSTQFYSLLLGIVLVNGLGMTCDIFNGDSALYASIAKNMALSKDYIHLNSIMIPNWIDKPHFSFWVWSSFIQIFGNTNVGFKLGTFLFYLVLLYYTFQFTAKNYSIAVAQIATIILASSLHIFISNNDVRIDMILIALMMGAICHFQSFIISNKIIQLVLGSIFTAMAIMTKGIFIAIPIGLTVIMLLKLYASPKNIFTPIWLLALVLVIIGISPALYALKIQFLTYDKGYILGQKASNYLQFFFWDSQFGRFNSNLGEVQSNGDPTFYLHTYLWAMAPWSLLILLVFFLKKNPFKEYVSLSNALAMLIIISISKTQLSHHILVLLPFLSILLAIILSQKEWKNGAKYILLIHYCSLGLILICGIYLSYIALGKWSVLAISLCVIDFILILSIHFFKLNHKLIYCTSLVGIYLGLFLNTIFYPEILQYQAGRNVSEYLTKHNIKDEIKEWYANPPLLNYYTSNDIKQIGDEYFDSHKPTDELIYSGDYAITRLKDLNISYRILDSFNEHRITVLSPEFIVKKTRSNVVQKMYLIRLTP